MEDVRVCTSQRTISAYVRYYSKFVQEVNHFIEVLTNCSVTKTKKNKGNYPSVIHKSGCGRLREWSQRELRLYYYVKPKF